VDRLPGAVVAPQREVVLARIIHERPGLAANMAHSGWPG
jgi:hypothetical protein